jgi:DeoR family transcriptional regulator, fructose operon transcriptional repressor
VGIDASTTLQRLVPNLREARDLTVLTNGPECFSALQRSPGVTALLTGGQLDRRTGSLVGPLAARSAHDLVLRRLFVSAAGIDPIHGTTEATFGGGRGRSPTRAPRSSSPSTAPSWAGTVRHAPSR